MLSSIVKRYMRDPEKTYFGLLKIQVKFYLCFISLLYLDLYVLGDGALIS